MNFHDRLAWAAAAFMHVAVQPAISCTGYEEWLHEVTKEE